MGGNVAGVWELVAEQLLTSPKSPRRLVAVAGIARSPNGKVEYRRLRELALAETSSSA